MTDDELRAAYMAGAPGALAWPWPEGLRAVLATSLTQAIQRLNGIPYNCTKSECIEVLRHLRADLSAPPAAARVPLTDEQLDRAVAAWFEDVAPPADAGHKFRARMRAAIEAAGQEDGEA